MSSKEQRRRVREYEARKQVHERARKRRIGDNVFAVLGVIIVGALATFGTIWHIDATTVRVPDPSLAEDRDWTGTMTLNGVELEFELDGEAAPQAVSSFIYDTQRDYYTDKTCHRLTIAEGFSVLQCGSLDGTGASDPDYSYGPIENAPEDDVYPAGTIAMARAGGDADSNGHQFFIVYADTTIPSDEAGGYTVIGQVTDGLDELVEQIVSLGLDPYSQSPEDGAPAVPVIIENVTVE